jgi:hypothetical protein
MRAWMLVLVTGLLACKREGPPASSSAPDASVAQADATAEVDAGTEQPWAVTAAELDAFIAYQTEMLGVWSAMVKDLQRLTEQGEGTGKAAARARTQVGEALRKRAEEEERAREKAGLTEAQVDALERLVADVLLQRAARRSAEDEALARQHAEIMAKLPPEARAAFEQTFPGGAASADAGTSELAAERALHGDQNVDRVLEREAQLTALWQKLMQVWSAARRD